jgi:hypothetical protein
MDNKGKLESLIFVFSLHTFPQYFPITSHAVTKLLSLETGETPGVLS